MGCKVSYCCLDEKDKFELVKQCIIPKSVSEVSRDGEFGVFVGRLELVHGGIVSILEERDCLLWRIHIMREIFPTNEDNAKNSRFMKENGRYWETIYEEERFADFYLTRDRVKLFINGLQLESCQSLTNHNCDDWLEFTDMPDEINAQLFNDMGRAEEFCQKGWGGICEKGVNYRVRERIVNINELACAMGCVEEGIETVTGYIVHILQPATAKNIAEDNLVSKRFSEWQCSALGELLANENVAWIDDQNLINQIEHTANLGHGVVVAASDESEPGEIAGVEMLEQQ